MENTLLQQDLEEERQCFEVKDLDQATWAFRKLRAIAEKRAEVENVANAEIERVNRWKEQQFKEFDSTKEYFEGLLTQYYAAEKAKDKKFKLSTPYGKVSSRKSSKWIYEDEEGLKEYLKTNNIDAIRIKEEIDKTSLKIIFKDGVNTETGEVLPFVHIEESETITVKAE
jgi:hypothetical protein